jgi:hypothetical protein
MSAAPADRIRTLLLRADNVLKNAGPDAGPGRVQRARDALLEAQAVAGQDGVDPRLSELIARRLDSLGSLEADGGS